jgi:hypothetical protein
MLSTVARRSVARATTGVVRRALLSSSAATTDAPSSFSHDKMETDKRYQKSQPVPESLLKAAATDEPNEFSIRGQFREGRAAYLDMSATTPLDPRVLDAMAPYMVSSETASSDQSCMSPLADCFSHYLALSSPRTLSPLTLFFNN